MNWVSKESGSGRMGHPRRTLTGTKANLIIRGKITRMKTALQRGSENVSGMTWSAMQNYHTSANAASISNPRLRISGTATKAMQSRSSTGKSAPLTSLPSKSASKSFRNRNPGHRPKTPASNGAEVSPSSTARKNRQRFRSIFRRVKATGSVSTASLSNGNGSISLP